MRNVTIVESNVEPNKEHLWFYNGKLKWFGPNGWEEINPQVPSPTTTPPPVVVTTTTTSTPIPTTTTTSTPSPGTTTSTSTSTAYPTFKLINGTGGTLTVEGIGYINGIISTTIPPILDGGSVFLVKSILDSNINLSIGLGTKLGIIVDGEDKGELSLSDPGSPLYIIPHSIFGSATEITVYSITTTATTTTTTSKPNVK